LEEVVNGVDREGGFELVYVYADAFTVNQVFWCEWGVINRAEMWEVVINVKTGEVRMELAVSHDVLREEGMCLFW
jgi:hypothetical protein